MIPKEYARSFYTLPSDSIACKYGCNLFSLAVPIYYKLHDLLNNASEFKNSFSGLDQDIGLAVEEGMKKYEKYYSFIDESDTYYTALILDPWVKGDLILTELQEDSNSGSLILEAIQHNLHQQYPLTVAESGLLISAQQSSAADTIDNSDVESRMLRRLQP
jgi:hypothetical protein